MADLRALLAAATPGPWYVDGPAFGGLWVCCGSDAVSGPVHPGHPDQPYAVLAGMGDPDAALIVAAVNALPALLDRIDALEAVATAADEMFRRAGVICPDCGCVDPHDPDDGSCAALPLLAALAALQEPVR